MWVCSSLTRVLAVGCRGQGSTASLVCLCMCSCVSVSGRGFTWMLLLVWTGASQSSMFFRMAAVVSLPCDDCLVHRLAPRHLRWSVCAVSHLLLVLSPLLVAPFSSPSVLFIECFFFFFIFHMNYSNRLIYSSHSFHSIRLSKFFHIDPSSSSYHQTRFEVPT